MLKARLAPAVSPEPRRRETTEPPPAESMIPTALKRMASGKIILSEAGATVPMYRLMSTPSAAMYVMLKSDITMHEKAKRRCSASVKRRLKGEDAADGATAMAAKIRSEKQKSAKEFSSPLRF